MTRKRHDAEMPSCCQDLKQLWLEGHGHWTCMAGLKAAWQMTTVGLSAACQLSNENIVLKVIFESSHVSWQRCIFRVLVISKQLCHFFLAYCKMCYILLIFLSNVLYIVVEYLDLLSEALFNEILYDCPTIFTNISVDKSSNRNRILYFFLCSHSWPHTTADLLIEKNVMKEVNSDL